MTGKQLRLLEALLTEPTITGACKKADVKRGTYYRYMKDPNFKEELRKRQAECLNSAVLYLQGSLALANETLVNILNDPLIAPQIKINAVNSIYQNSKIMTDVEALERLKDIERTLRELEGGETVDG